MMSICRICGNGEGNEDVTLREMMFGLGEHFRYVHCGQCRCLQIAEIPTDMLRYYPDEYYSRELPPEATGASRWLRRLEGAIRLHVSNRLFRAGRQRRIFEWLRATGASVHSSILDVGCGSGRLLQELREFGFRNLVGVDPFLSEGAEERSAVPLHRSELDALDGRFDLIMMHHSLEHAPDQQTMLRAVAERLTKNGWLLVRIPLIGGYAWRHYGADWLALDAPRHFYVHSEKSASLLLQQTGFAAPRVVYDSGSQQFWGSEQYRRGIPHRCATSYDVCPERSIFSREQILEYEQRSRELNRERDGDTACFYARLA